jgi:hypothetical protein
MLLTPGIALNAANISDSGVKPFASYNVKKSKKENIGS